MATTLHSPESQEFRLNQMPALVKLKYLKIQVHSDADLIFSQIIDFIKACPVLETFALQRKEVDKTCSFECLKVLELHGGKGNTIDQEVVKSIISKAPGLEKLTIDTCFRQLRCFVSEFPEPEIVEAVEAKARKLCQKSPQKIDLTIIR